ncbi:hypothetical protein QA447_07920 [Pseudomonas sp. abacavir_1]
MNAVAYRHSSTSSRGNRWRPLGALLLALGLLLGACSAEAGRELPSGMLVGVVDSASFPVITLKRPKPNLLKQVVSLGLYQKTVSYPVAVSVRIRNENNLFIVNGLMPQLKDKFVALKSGLSGQVNQIWVLTEAEAEEYVQRPDTRFPPRATLLKDDETASSQ